MKRPSAAAINSHTCSNVRGRNARKKAFSFANACSIFQYDGTGRRISKTINGQSAASLYDVDQIVQELSGGIPVADLLAGVGPDELWTRTDAAGTLNFLIDGQGSTASLADAGGALRTQYTYEPFGVTFTAGATSANAFQYTGRENDNDGLYYYRARYYSPGVGRFLSEDPAGWRGGINLYGYVGDNPVNLTDPNGLGPLDCALYLYWYRRCAQSAADCAKKLEGKYPDPIDRARS